MKIVQKSIIAAAALLTVAVLGGGTALATANTVIGFDDQAAGTIITNQYQSEGVVFGMAAALGAPFSPGNGDCGGPAVVNDPATAYSPPNYADLQTCAQPSAVPTYYGGTFGAFTNYARGSMSVEVRLISGPPTDVTITGYDTSGTVVATGTATPAAGGGWTKLVATQAAGSTVPALISYFEIRTTLTGVTSQGNAPTIGIDDLSFDQAGAPLSARGIGISARPGTQFSGPVATISDGDPTAAASDYTATINWGDGSSSIGTVTATSSPPNGQFTVTGSHEWLAAGSYPVHTAVTKVNGRTTAADATASVTGGGGGGTSPSASLAQQTPNPTAGGLVTLSGANSTPGTGRIIAYDWGFDSNVTSTSTGTNPTAHWIFKPGFHTVTLTVTNSGGQHSTTHLGLTVSSESVPFVNDGGQGACQPTYTNGNIQIVADCIQTLSGGGYVIETHYLNLNGMVLAPKPGNLVGVYKILPFNHLGIGSGTELTGSPVNFELLNTPIGDMVLGGQDLSANPIILSFTAFRPPQITLHLGRDRGPRARASAGGSGSGGSGGGSGSGTGAGTQVCGGTTINSGNGSGGGSGSGSGGGSGGGSGTGSGGGVSNGGGAGGCAPTTKELQLMSLGVGQSCVAGDKSPTCCPPTSGTTACATLPGGFPLTGSIVVWLTNNGELLFDVQVGLDLEAVNFQATGALEIEADPIHGISLNSLQFTIPSAMLANIFDVTNASFVYYFPSDPDPTKADSWQAKGQIAFGPLNEPSLAGELDFKKGQFKKASMTLTLPPGVGIPIFTGVLLNQIGATVGVNPFVFGGELGASVATQLELTLQFLYQEPTDTTLGFFGGEGQLYFQTDKIAQLAADVYSDGYVDAAIDIDLHFPFNSDDPVVEVTGHIGFWDEPSSGRWEADGSVGLKLWVISAEVAGLVNDKQVAGCADVDGFGVQGHYDFADGSIGGGFFGFSNCDDQLKQYKETPVTPHSGGFVSSARDVTGSKQLTAADTRGGGTVRLPGGTDGQELLISSAGGTPVVQIYAPNGQIYTTPARPGQISTAGGEFISAIAPDGHSVIVFFRHPKAGLYNIQPTAASAPITSVAAAQDVPPARITVKVRHAHGRRWSLRYAIKNYVAGTQVQFVERGRDSAHVLATVRGPSGTIFFTPQAAVGRARAIFAYLQTSTGAPLRTMTVGRYLAPPAQRPGRVRHVEFSRGASTAVLSWTAAPGARQYRVLIRGTDGRVVSGLTTRRRLQLTGVDPTFGLTATITPMGGPNMLPGPSTRTTLAPVSTGLVELLRCAGSRCAAQVVSGNLVLSAREIHATLTRDGRTIATGIASNGRTAQVALMVSRGLPAGRYGLTLTAGRRSTHRTISIR